MEPATPHVEGRIQSDCLAIGVTHGVKRHTPCPPGSLYFGTDGCNVGRYDNILGFQISQIYSVDPFSKGALLTYLNSAYAKSAGARHRCRSPNAYKPSIMPVKLAPTGGAAVAALLETDPIQCISDSVPS